MFCSNCGNKLSGSEDFCTNCGTKVNKINEVKEENKKPKSSKRVLPIILIVLIIITVLILLIIFICSKFTNKKEEIKDTNTDNEEISYTYDSLGNTKFIDGTFSTKVVKSTEDVKSALNEIKDKIGIKDVDKELKLDYEETSEDITFYRFNQVYNDIEVLDKNIIVSVDSSGTITSYSGYLESDINIDTTPKLEEAKIEEIAKNELGEEAKIIDKKLYIKASENDNLIYLVNGYSKTKALKLEIDANSGEIISTSPLLDAATNYEYSGEGLNGKTYKINLEEYYDIDELKTKYRFYDSKRNIAVADYSLIGDVLATFISALPGASPYSVDIEDGKIKIPWYNNSIVYEAVSAMANFETIYDYYKNVLGRDSYDNKGSKIIVNIGITDKTFTNEDLNNAFWFNLTKQMYIGYFNGKSLTVALDVLAHEFTHGVVNSITKFSSSQDKANKDKAFETGALSEAYPDIMGALIEGKNWTMAEDVETLRDGKNPEEYKNPSKKNGEYYYPDGYLKNGITLEQFLKNNELDGVQDYDNGGIHKNANVVVHAAYLMYESGAFKNREQMAKVWYNSLFYLSSRSDFEDCALAVIKSAKNLKLSNSSIQKITQAFKETNMLESEEYKVSGKVTYGETPVNKCEIKIYSTLDNSLITTIETTKDGKYETLLKTGNYKVVASKENLNTYEGNLVIKDNTTYNIDLGKKETTDNEEKEDSEDDTKELTKVCKSSNCINITVYFIASGDNNNIKIDNETFALEKGKPLSSGIIVNTINNYFKTEFITTNGESFYINLGGVQAEFAWYYHDTETKFKWDQPLYEDVEIEMKLLNGLIDNDLIKDIYDMFN